MRSLATTRRTDAQARAAEAAAIALGAFVGMREMVVEWMGESVETAGEAALAEAAKDRRRALAEFQRLPADARQQLLQRLNDVLWGKQAEVNALQNTNKGLSLALASHREANLRGVVEGLRMAAARASAAAPAPEPETAHEESRKPWRTFEAAFFADKPGFSESTRVSHKQAFTELQRSLEGKTLGAVNKSDIVKYAEWLRDRPNKRGGQLNRKSIVRMLQHIRSYFQWAVSKNYIKTNPADGVVARDKTVEEKREIVRRSFTDEEMTKFFNCPIFTGCQSSARRLKKGDFVIRDEIFWFFIAAALTAIRTEELAEAPSKLVYIGGVPCIDLRVVGKKTIAGARLVPVIDELRRVGFIEWMDAQHKRGHGLVHNPKKPRTSDAWSKLGNRYIRNVLGHDPLLVLYSFRHRFRPVLRASGLGDELIDKFFGHETGSVGSRYGVKLEPEEAQMMVKSIGTPITLEHLWILKPQH